MAIMMNSLSQPAAIDEPQKREEKKWWSE